MIGLNNFFQVRLYSDCQTRLIFNLQRSLRKTIRDEWDILAVSLPEKVFMNTHEPFCFYSSVRKFVKPCEVFL